MIKAGLAYSALVFGAGVSMGIVRIPFLVPRFGNLLAKPEDSGFDVLSVRPRVRADGSWEAEVHTVLAPLGRPLDVHAWPGGRVLILEYTRPTNFKDRLGWLPGRILELAPAVQPANSILNK